MSEYTQEQRLADFETLADARNDHFVFAASERIRQYVVALEERLSRARAEALEEAAQAAEKSEEKARQRLNEARHPSAASVADAELNVFEAMTDGIRALIATSAPATIPVEKVREVLKGMRDHPTMWDETTADEAARRLGVELDGNPCVGCGHPPHLRGKCHQQFAKGLCVCAVEP